MGRFTDIYWSESLEAPRAVIQETPPVRETGLSRRKGKKKIIEYDIFISFLPALWDHHSPIIPLPPYSHMDGCRYCISPKCREQHPMRSTLMVLCKLLVQSTH